MDRVLQRARSGPDPALAAELKRLHALFREDMAVARARSISPRAKALVEEIDRLVDVWMALSRGVLAHPMRVESAKLDQLHSQITERFATLVDVAAGDGFTLRQRALNETDDQQLTTWLALAAMLLVTLTTTLVIGRSVLRPLDAAVGVAGRIADGDLNVAMPTGRTEETAKLFAAMTVMQANLRTKMEHEATLRESAQLRLVDAIESSSEGVIVLDAEDRIVVANSQFGRYVPALAEILVPGTCFGDALVEGIRRGLFDASFGTVEEQRARYVKTREKDRFVREIKLADGRWVRVSRSRTRDGGAVVIWGDITAMKEREARLEFARAQAEAASRAKTEFLANMSHELRTPLNAINGFAEVLAKEMMGPLGRKEYVDYAKVVLDSGRHLLAIINDILDLSKSEAGRLDIDPAPANVEEILETCYRIMIDQCRAANLHFDLEKDANLPTIEADATRVRQIVLNLLSNAAKFTEPGGAIVLGAATEGSDLVLSVRDTGIGMRAEDIPLALEPFGQIDSSLSRRYQGTGLGLPLTKRLVELHGGRMEIRSAPGRGTEVKVRLPIRRLPAATKVLALERKTAGA
jgi:signal transduction histidine kinase/HAMP domain-containing protein